jgi:hypothetical protein
VKLAKFLIEEGADVNAIDQLGDTPCGTPFINCARSGDVKLCKFLVEWGADPSIRRNDGLLFMRLPDLIVLMSFDFSWEFAGWISMLNVKMMI